MNNKIEFIKFIALISIRKNLITLNGKLKSYEAFKDELAIKSLKMNILEIKKQCQSLFNTEKLEELTELIIKVWPTILTYLIEDPELYKFELKDLFCTKEFPKNKELLKWYKILYYHKVIIAEQDINKTRPFYADILSQITNKDIDLLEIYIDIVNYKLFDPNKTVGTTDEPFWTMIPNDLSSNNKVLSETNRKVILDPRIDYYLLSNGSDPIKSKFDICSYDSYSPQEKKSNITDAIAIIKENNFSIIDTYRKRTNGNGINLEAIIHTIFYENYDPNISKQIKDLREYLLSTKGINMQIENSIYMNPERNSSIDFYIKKIQEKENVKSNNNIKKLKALKF